MSEKEWLGHLLSAEPVDRPTAERLLRAVYAANGLAEPRHVLWCASPLEAMWVVAALAEPGKAPKREGVRERIQRDLGAPLWDTAVAEAGSWHWRERFDLEALELKLGQARSTFLIDSLGMNDYIAHLSGGFAELGAMEDKILGRGEGGLASDQAVRAGARNVSRYINRTIYGAYHWADMARDESLGQPSPESLRSIWAAAKSVGLWWPFGNAIVACDRPVESGPGPRLRYSDGFIIEPPPPPEPKKKSNVKVSALLALELPRDHAARITLLGERGGSLPRYERYLAGEREKVWAELVALGDAVRTDAHAADALAVAYETMTRVERNVRTIVGRLRALGYKFRDEREEYLEKVDTIQSLASILPKAGSVPGLQQHFRSQAAPKSGRDESHVPPGKGTWKAIRALEREAGTLPLSLRAFYDTVGAVDLCGSHPPIAGDPLVVYGAEEVIDGIGETEDGFAIPISPDDLHKENTSGGDPYEIDVPAPAADARLVNSPGERMFVEYLRASVAAGGFQLRDGLEPI